MIFVFHMSDVYIFYIPFLITSLNMNTLLFKVWHDQHFNLQLICSVFLSQTIRLLTFNTVKLFALSLIKLSDVEVNQ